MLWKETVQYTQSAPVQVGSVSSQGKEQRTLFPHTSLVLCADPWYLTLLARNWPLSWTDIFWVVLETRHYFCPQSLYTLKPPALPKTG